MRIPRWLKGWTQGYREGYHDATRAAVVMLPLDMTHEERLRMLSRLEERWARQR